MDKFDRTRIFFRLFCLLFIPLLTFFYMKYVPLVPSFQVMLLPVLLAVLLLMSFDPDLGTLFFVFAFPLINSLPYFFGIFDHIPHAPTALVLFLFYFLGWCVHMSFSQKKISFDAPILKPLALFSLLILISGLFTYLRFSNFYPFLSDRVYELVTNVNGVTAGGAIMSTFLHALNYITGFVFLFILVNTIKSREYAKKILSVLLTSVAFSILFGFYQIIRDMGFGNTPFWVRLEQINATFKGPNSFGAFLAAMVPLVLGSFFLAKRARKVLFFVFFLSVLYLFPHIGTRSAFLGLAVSFLAFFLLAIKAIPVPKKTGWKVLKTSAVRIVALVAVIAVLIAGVVSFTRSRLYDRLRANIEDIVLTRNWVKLSPERYFLWKEAYGMIRSYPLTGVGIGAYIIELPNYYLLDKDEDKSAIDSFRRIDSAENYFLHAGAELGIIGLLIVIWIFIHLFRLLARNYRNLLPGDGENFLYLGVAAGLISLFSNFFFHSFIGNFETKYTFWLLAGIIVVWGKFQGEPRAKIPAGRAARILAAGAIFLFGGFHFWNCTHSLSLKNRTELFGLKQDFGFYQVETTEEGQKFRWTREYGGLTLKVEKPVLKIPLHASHPDIEKDPVSVGIYLVKEFFKEKRLLGEVVLSDSGWRTFAYSIPEEVGKEAILLIEVSRTWNPQKELGVPDPRRLGVALGEIEQINDPGS
jgi:O-antigen ligase